MVLLQPRALNKPPVVVFLNERTGQVKVIGSIGQRGALSLGRSGCYSFPGSLSAFVCAPGWLGLHVLEEEKQCFV